MSRVYVKETDPSKARDITLCMLAAFKDDRLQKTMFPGERLTGERYEQYIEFRTERLRLRGSEPGKRWFVAVDREKDCVVGFIAMNAPSTEIGLIPPPSNADPEFVNEKFNREVREAYHKLEEETMRARTDYWCLASLGVHPTYQGKGVASILARRGLELVDNEGKDVFVSATPVARPFYEKRGFRTVKTLPLLDGEYVLTAMIRDAAGSA